MPQTFGAEMKARDVKTKKIHMISFENIISLMWKWAHQRHYVTIPLNYTRVFWFILYQRQGTTEYTYEAPSGTAWLSLHFCLSSLAFCLSSTKGKLCLFHRQKAKMWRRKEKTCWDKRKTDKNLKTSFRRRKENENFGLFVLIGLFVLRLFVLQPGAAGHWTFSKRKSFKSRKWNITHLILGFDTWNSVGL